MPIKRMPNKLRLSKTSQANEPESRTLDGSLRVGIISETLVQQHHLRSIVEACRYESKVTCLIHHILSDVEQLDQIQGVDVWLIEVDFFNQEQSDQFQSFERWLFDLKQPVIFGEGTTYNVAEQGFNSWSRQVEAKLMSVAGQLSLAQGNKKSASYVWVLAASTGGPEAIKTFLDHLPLGLDIAFIYAQHIEPHHNQSLANIITRDNGFSARLAKHGGTIRPDVVTIVPVEEDLEVLGNGTLVVRPQSWRGCYRPSIDQVVAMVANRFGPRSGVIFFSGMGDDGATGARLMARQGGRVWIQTPGSCASDSMPQIVSETGTVSATGTPRQLADQLVDLIKPCAQPVMAGVN